MTAQAQQRFDIYQSITDRIVTAIEVGAGEFQLPWIRRTGNAFARPINIASANPYNGINIVSLWVEAISREYTSNIWGTYRQWQDRGCQVRKGEKSALVVFYKPIEECADNADEETSSGRRLIARTSWVFNASQVDGFTIAEQAIPDAPQFDPIIRAESFAAQTGATITEGGEKACFIPSEDLIRMPDRNRFTGTATSSPAEAFYATLCHELVHWSGAKSRLDRDLSGRFGTESYAIEELIAELGAAFLCADLGITPEPRADHAAYIQNWLTVLKSDKRAIFAAASKASEAAQWLLSREAAAS
ncbi:MAG: DUF1738 domain-containing protein [Alphaproteobacteria bacterium]|nr:DUF1738 domain-containing protein [Alphaproteobacteria bacterium]